MSRWTCSSCGQEYTSNIPMHKCAICLQTEAIEEQTRLLRQIHNVPEEPEYKAEDGYDGGHLAGFFILIVWICGLILLFS
jgi:hypothetical protein